METNLTEPTTASSTPAALPGKSPACKVIGVGRAGANIVEELIRSGLEGAAFVVLSADQDTLANSSAAGKIHLGTGLPNGLGAGGGDRGRCQLESFLPKLKTLCADVRFALIIAGLGGRRGTEICLAAVKAAREAGALTLAFVTLPFDCEGSLRQQQADDGLKQLRDAADGVFCLPNQKTVPLIHEETSVMDTFKVSNQLLADGLRGVCRAVTSASVMGLPFPDLCALMRERQGETAFAAADASGPNRSREAVEKLLAHPLLNGGRLLREAETVLVSVAGGPDLTMAEVNRVMEQINNQCQGVPVVMGAGVHPSFKGSLAVVLMLAGVGETVKPAGGFSESSQTSSPAGAQRGAELDTQLLTRTTTARSNSRFTAPPPVLTTEQREQLIAKKTGATARQRKNAARLRQTQLPLEIISKGRFDKSEPTIHKGEDLDVPTFIRRGVVLN